MDDNRLAKIAKNDEANILQNVGHQHYRKTGMLDEI